MTNVRTLASAVLFTLGSALLVALGACSTSPPAPTPTPTLAPARFLPITSEAGGPGRQGGEIVPFTNIAPASLGDNALIDSRYPGVALFDYDGDGDLDIYVTLAEEGGLFAETIGGPNKLFRNDGNNTFTEVAQEAGVAIPESNNSGVVACDLNNDGHRDLYVGAYGRVANELGFRSESALVIKDRLLLNKGDGTFTDITDAAFGDAVNVRSASSIACADVNNDGWLDIFVANRSDVDFTRFNSPKHHGHHNVLYANNGDMTFTDVTDEAGLLGPQIVMLDPQGNPITFMDPETGKEYEGYDPTMTDKKGNRVGDPAGQSWAVQFFDLDDDGDQDLWLADDGDRLKVYRNDSTKAWFKFTPIGRQMGLEAGQWMGFAVGDYDGDVDLDVFVTNMGFHPLTRPPATVPGADCGYSHTLGWGTCLHYLLRNDGTTETPEMGTVGKFPDAAGATPVEPSPIMPPGSLDPSNIDPAWQAPTGLEAYDFGFGTVFFDYDNDGDQDLYWLGSVIAAGEGPDYGPDGTAVAPGAGRLLRGNGRGAFEDITIRAHLLDIEDVDYSLLDPSDPNFDAQRQRIAPNFHENGKALAKGDINGDGYVDLIGSNSSGVKFDPAKFIRAVSGPLFIWVNGGGDFSWLKLRLQGRMAVDGTGTNADGVGARVYVRARVDGENVSTQVLEASAGSSFLSSHDPNLHFGLGLATRVETVTILWPSGVEQVLTDLEVNQVVEVTEPSAS